MPVADYRCKLCGQEWEVDLSPLPLTVEKEHESCDNKVLNRVWSFKVGRGTSGNTPPRS